MEKITKIKHRLIQNIKSAVNNITYDRVPGLPENKNIEVFCGLLGFLFKFCMDFSVFCLDFGYVFRFLCGFCVDLEVFRGDNFGISGFLFGFCVDVLVSFMYFVSISISFASSLRTFRFFGWSFCGVCVNFLGSCVYFV